MPYTINKFDGTPLVVLEDGTVDVSTSLQFVGRSYIGYGEIHNENFLFLMENFAGRFPPSRPIIGQTWFDKGDVESPTNLLKVFDGEGWKVVGSAILSETAPIDPPTGYLWIDASSNTLNAWNGESWVFIGPETVPNFGTTRARSTKLRDTSNVEHAVIMLTVNGSILAIASSSEFLIKPEDRPVGFTNLIKGLNFSITTKIQGDLQGTADRAKRLETPILINQTLFDGSTNVIVRSPTIGSLIPGDYVVGSNFEGSNETIWSVDATSANIIGKVVARNSEGGFSAGTITARLVGDVLGNVVSTSGTSSFNIIEVNRVIGTQFTGNSGTATKLQVPRTINGVLFDGTSNITVTADAATLTGSDLNTNILNSNLQTVGVLSSLSVDSPGITLGPNNGFKILISDSRPAIETKVSMDLDVNLGPSLTFATSQVSLAAGGPNEPSILSNNLINLGGPSRKFNNVYANDFYGNLIGNISGNSETVTNGVYVVGDQNINGVKTFIGSLKTTSDFLVNKPNAWTSLQSSSTGNPGTNKSAGISIGESGYKGNAAIHITYSGDGYGNIGMGTVNSVTSVPEHRSIRLNYLNKDVEFFGNISMAGSISSGSITSSGTISAPAFSGPIAGNSSSSTKLATARKINGVLFDGTSDITIEAIDPSKAPLTSAALQGSPTSSTPPKTDNSTRIATTSYVKTVVDEAIASIPPPPEPEPPPYWAGTTTFANVVATYVNYPIGTKVAYWEERIYYRSANSNGGNVQIDDRYRRVIRKNSSSSWGDVGG